MADTVFGYCGSLCPNIPLIMTYHLIKKKNGALKFIDITLIARTRSFRCQEKFLLNFNNYSVDNTVYFFRVLLEIIYLQKIPR